MEKIERHIFELLFQHDCVILPGLGGFVADYKMAVIEQDKGRMMPPAKQFLFNKHLVNNDGLLANKIAETENVDYTKAITILNEFVTSVKKELNEKRRFELTEIGVLHVGVDHNIRFKPERTNFLINSFGLPVIKAIPVEQPEPIVESAEKMTRVKPIEVVHEEDKLLKEETKVISIEQGNKRRSNWWIAAVAIPVMFYSAWIPLKTDMLKENGSFHYSDLNPFTFHKERVYVKQALPILKSEKVVMEEGLVLPENDNYLFYSIDDEVNTVIELEKKIQPKVETTFVEKKPIKDDVVIDASLNYHLIGGCFGEKSNAEAFVQDMNSKGYHAFILDMNKGLHRVSVAQFASRSEAKSERTSFKDQDISTWVLKK